MAEMISQLLATDAARVKLGVEGERLMLIGQTDGGRVLTLVIERTLDPTTWLIVTGWPATDRERRILD